MQGTKSITQSGHRTHINLPVPPASSTTPLHHLLCPMQIPLVGHHGQSLKPSSHIHTHSQTFLLQPRRLMHTVQTCTALFPNHYCGESLESDEFLWLCIGKRAEVDFFSFGTGLVGHVLHPRNCGSFPVSALIHLAGRRLVLGL